MGKNGNHALAREYRKKYGPDMPTLKLARIMYKENNLTFNSLETARKALRVVEGKAGDKARKEAADKTLFVAEERSKNPYKLPESDEEDYTPYLLRAKRTLILNDIHFPFHSISSLTSAIDYGININPDAILLNGDVLDAFQLSKFIKDPKQRHFHEELEMFREFFALLKREFPKTKIYYKLGNHDERYEHFLWTKAKELVGVPEYKFENIIQARAEGITVIGEKKIIKINDFNVFHGHEFAGSGYSPISPARSLFNRAASSSGQGHNHQTSETEKKVVGGKSIMCYSFGALCGLHPQWLPNNNWNHGLAYVDADLNGPDYEVFNKRINERGRVY